MVCDGIKNQFTEVKLNKSNIHIDPCLLITLFIDVQCTEVSGNNGFSDIMDILP